MTIFNILLHFKDNVISGSVIYLQNATQMAKEIKKLWSMGSKNGLDKLGLLINMLRYGLNWFKSYQ